MQPLDVGGVVEVPHAQALLDPLDAVVGQDRRVRLLVDGVVDVLAQPGDDAVDLRVQLRGLLGGTRDDERRARLVDQDRVHLVDDGEAVPALDVALDRILDVVAQVVEPELGVGPVGDVRAVALLALAVGEAVNHDPHGHAEELVDAPHPLRVAAGQVVVDGDDVDALAGQRVQIDRQRGDQGLALAGLHLGDAAAVEHHPADELHVEVPHPQHALARLAADGERLGEEIVQRLANSSPGGSRRRRNSAVISRRSASDLACIDGSSWLIRSTIGRIPLMTRAFLVPKIFLATKLIMGGGRKWRP